MKNSITISLAFRHIWINLIWYFEILSLQFIPLKILENLFHQSYSQPLLPFRRKFHKWRWCQWGSFEKEKSHPKQARSFLKSSIFVGSTKNGTICIYNNNRHNGLIWKGWKNSQQPHDFSILFYFLLQTYRQKCLRK